MAEWKIITKYPQSRFLVEFGEGSLQTSQDEINGSSN